MWAKNKNHGFTIVELLIVIVVIAVLAAITIVAFNGVQAKALNSSRMSEYTQWRKVIEIYKVETGAYPIMPEGGYCLGTGFPGGKCRDYTRPVPDTLNYTEADSAPLMNMIKKYTSIPSAQHVAVNNTVGPYVNYKDGYMTITVVLKGKASDCPAGLTYLYDDNGLLLCAEDIQL